MNPGRLVLPALGLAAAVATFAGVRLVLQALPWWGVVLFGAGAAVVGYIIGRREGA